MHSLDRTSLASQTYPSVASAISTKGVASKMLKCAAFLGLLFASQMRGCEANNRLVKYSPKDPSLANLNFSSLYGSTSNEQNLEINQAANHEEIEQKIKLKTGHLPTNFHAFLESLPKTSDLRQDFSFNSDSKQWDRVTTCIDYQDKLIANPHGFASTLPLSALSVQRNDSHKQLIIHLGGGIGRSYGGSLLEDFRGTWIENQHGLSLNKPYQGFLTLTDDLVFIYWSDTDYAAGNYGAGYQLLPVIFNRQAVVINLKEIGMSKEQFLDNFENQAEFEWQGQWGSLYLPLDVQ